MTYRVKQVAREIARVEGSGDNDICLCNRRLVSQWSAPDKHVDAYIGDVLVQKTLCALLVITNKKLMTLGL